MSYAWAPRGPIDAYNRGTEPADEPSLDSRECSLRELARAVPQGSLGRMTGNQQPSMYELDGMTSSNSESTQQNADSNRSEAASQAAPGVSGRNVTVAIVVALLVVGGVLSLGLWTYNSLDSSRDASRLAWRELSQSLADRYRQIEKDVAVGVDTREVDMEFGERFRLAIDRFRTTAQPELQFQAAKEMEELLAGTEFAKPPSEKLLNDLDVYRQTLEQQRLLIAGPGGRLLSTVLKLVPPEDLELAEGSAADNSQ